ncbi:MAG: DeoR/GlpR family DNA-binding transcription regulator [Armatimonadota bacterium]
MDARQSAIIDLIGQEQRVVVSDLAKRFAVSEMTIRRDLTELEAQGLLVRTHGGAVIAGRLRFIQRAFPKYVISPEKEAIGLLAASLVSPGETVMVDRGTTALEVSLRLPQDAGITVATTSLMVAQALYGSPVNVLILGGYLSKDFPSLYGPPTENMLESLHVNTLFLGCDGADSLTGLYTVDLHVAKFEHAMMLIADRVVVVTESHKFRKKAFAKFGTWRESHLLVTDSGLSMQDRKNLEDQGIQILIAEPA